MHNEQILKQIYMSDVVVETENSMMNQVDKTVYEILDEFHKKLNNRSIVLSEEELDTLEKYFHDFVFDYGFVQFKRGIQIGISMNDI